MRRREGKSGETESKYKSSRKRARSKARGRGFHCRSTKTEKLRKEYKTKKGRNKPPQTPTCATRRKRGGGGNDEEYKRRRASERKTRQTQKTPPHAKPSSPADSRFKIRGSIERRNAPPLVVINLNKLAVFRGNIGKIAARKSDKIAVLRKKMPLLVVDVNHATFLYRGNYHKNFLRNTAQ